MCLCSVPRYNGIGTNKGVSPENGSEVISAGGSNDGKEDMEQLLYPAPESLTNGGLDEEKSSFQDVAPLIFCLSAYAVNKFVAEVYIYTYTSPYSVTSCSFVLPVS